MRLSRKENFQHLAVILFIVVFFFSSNQIVSAQSGAVCGQLRLAPGLDPYPLFVPHNSNEAWFIDPFAGPSLISIMNGWPDNWGGKYVRVWDANVGSGDWFGPGTWGFTKVRLFANVSRWEFVASCEPTINFTIDRSTIAQGECTTLRWNVQNIEAIYLDGNGVAGSGERTVCPTVNTTYTLRAITYIGETSRTVAINVGVPIPVPVPTPIPPTATPLPSSQPEPLTEPSIRTSSNVNLRSGPGTTYSIIGRALAGTSMRITGKNPAGNWWQVCCTQGRSSWVASWVVTAYGPLEGIGVIDGNGANSGTTPRFWEPVSGIGEGIEEPVGSTAHTGYDAFAIDYVYEREGVDVYPALPGQIVFSACRNNDYGCTVVIRHWDDTKWDRKYYSVYAHLQDSGRKPVGADVDGRVPIGKMGKTGDGSNSIIHLHFAVRSSNEVLEGTNALYGTSQQAFNVRPVSSQ